MTVTALLAGSVLDGSLQNHIQRAKDNGISADEMAEVLTHAAMAPINDRVMGGASLRRLPFGVLGRLPIGILASWLQRSKCPKSFVTGSTAMRESRV